MTQPLTELRDKNPEKVRGVLNVLVEAPYFYRTDNEELFFFLRRHRGEFAQFYEYFYGWKLIMDGKCARVYKERWYNDKVTEANRDLFTFRRRDECIAFMVLLEFFEQHLEENAMTVEDRDELRFRFGDLLQYSHRRFVGLFPEQADAVYSEDHVRGILRQILPVLERYRMLKRLRPPPDVRIEHGDMIFEALPALYHYNASRLSRSVADSVDDEDPDREQAVAADEAEDAVEVAP